MPQHTIAITEHAFQLLMEAKKRHHDQGSMFSNTRLIHYLLELEAKMLETLRIVVDSQDPPQVRYDIMLNGIREGLSNRPSVLPREVYRPSRNASMQKRIECTLQIEARLGIKNPPRELVNYYLDHPDLSVMRDAVLNQQARKNEVDNLKMGFPPDTQAQP